MTDLEIWFFQSLVTFYLLGLIWIVQLVHYPAFAFVEGPSFKTFHSFHSRRITWIVAGPMTLELLLSSLLLYLSTSLPAVINFSSVVGLWLFTFLVSVPLHNQLAVDGKMEKLLERLVRTNWLRTTLWSARAIALSGFLIWLMGR